MKLSINANYLRKALGGVKRTPEECVKLAYEAGFRVIDYSPEYLADSWEREAHAVRAAADKYGVKYHTLRDRAINDDWTRLRDEASSKAIALTEQSIAEAVADNATANERCRAKVYELFEICADNMKRSGHVTAQSVRHLSAALKDLQADEPKQVDVEDLSPLVELLKL